jgi:hypothetical protein
MIIVGESQSPALKIHQGRARNAILKFVESQVEVEKGRLRGKERTLGIIKVKGRPSVPLRRREIDNAQDLDVEEQDA